MKKDLRLIYGLFGLSILILLFLFFSYTQKFAKASEYNVELTNTQEVLSRLQKLQLAFADIRVEERKFLLNRQDTTNTEYFIVEKSRRVDTIVNAIEILVANNSRHRPDLVKLRDDINKRFMVMQDAIKESQNPGINAIDVYDTREQQASKKIIKRIEKMEDQEIEYAESVRTIKRSSESLAPKYVELIIALAIIFQCTTFVFMLVEFKRRKQKEKELELKIIQVDSSRNELEEIAFVASHDLKEPLRKIRLFNNALFEEPMMTPERRKAIAKIDEFAKKMQELLDDLLDYIGLTRANEQIALIYLDKIIQEESDRLCKEHGINYPIITMNELPRVEAYPHQVTLLFKNLIENSIKYKQPAHNLQISVTSEKVAREKVTIANNRLAYPFYQKVIFSDNGIGFNNDFARKIFQIFQRLHTQTAPFSGKGMGLAMCKRVMTNHYGMIEADGTPNAGATFILYFPITTIS